MTRKLLLGCLAGVFILLTGCSLIAADTNVVSVVSAPLETGEMGSERCAGCHQSQFAQWQANAHASSRETLSEIAYAQDRCAEHMTAEGFLAQAEEEVTLETAEHSLTCVVCHQPHEGREGFTLRMPKEELCITCHNAEGPKVGSDVHHPQKEMFLGYGGIGVPEMPARKYRLGISCADCHMPLGEKAPEARMDKGTAESKWPQLLQSFLDKGVIEADGQEYRAKNAEALAGHDFKVRVDEAPSSCRPCHPDGNAEKFTGVVQSRQQATEATLVQLEPQLAALTEFMEGKYPEEMPAEESWSKGERLYFEAKLNIQLVEADGSMGFHNFNYAQQLLRVAGQKLESATKLLLPPEVSEQ